MRKPGTHLKNTGSRQIGSKWVPGHGFQLPGRTQKSGFQVPTKIFFVPTPDHNINFDWALKELALQWKKLNDAILHRRENLNKSLKIQQFLQECSEAISFISNRTEILATAEIPVTVAESEQALRNHERSSQEVQTFQSRIDKLGTQFGW